MTLREIRLSLLKFEQKAIKANLNQQLQLNLKLALTRLSERQMHDEFRKIDPNSISLKNYWYCVSLMEIITNFIVEPKK